MSRALDRADAVRHRRPTCCGVRPADRAHAGRRGPASDHGRARRDEGRRQRPLRRDPLGAAAPRVRRPAAGRGHRRGVRRRARGRATRTGTVVRLICTALRSHDPERERGARRDGGAVHGCRADRLGPGRSRGGLSRIPSSTAAPSTWRARPACASRSTPGNGAAPPQVRRSLVGGPGARRPRLAHHRRPVARAPSSPSGASRWTCARPRTGRPGPHPTAGRPSARPAPPRGRAGDPQHGRHDRVRHHASARSTSTRSRSSG